jgi:hypothetical protein
MYQRAQEQSGAAPNFDGEGSSNFGNGATNGASAGEEEDVVDAEVVDESN